MTLALVLEVSHLTGVVIALQARKMGRRNITKIKGGEHAPFVGKFIFQVVDEELEEERVRFGVENADFVSKSILEERIEAVHLQFAPLKDAKAVLERLVDIVSQLAHLDTDQALIEDSKVEAVRLLGQMTGCLLLRNEPNVAPFGHVLDGLAVRSVIHQLIEVPSHFVRFALFPLLGVVIDVWFKVWTCSKAEAAVQFD